MGVWDHAVVGHRRVVLGIFEPAGMAGGRSIQMCVDVHNIWVLTIGPCILTIGDAYNTHVGPFFTFDRLENIQILGKLVLVSSGKMEAT